MFVDDLIMFYKADLTLMEILIQALYKFTEVSGMKANISR